MEESPLIVRGPRIKREEKPVSLGEFFYQRLREHGDRVALEQEVDGQLVSLTYTDVLRMGSNFTVFLREERSLKAGDTVLLCCSNTLEFAPILMGTMFLGGTLAPINPRFDTDDMLHLLGVVQPSLVICNSLSEAAMTAAIAKSAQHIPWVSMDDITQIMNKPKDVKIDLGQVDPVNDVAFVMCSSGTSGKPKGVELIHSRVYPLIEKNIFCMEVNQNHGDDHVALNMAGPNWVSCLLVTLSMILSGNKLVLLNNPTVESLLQTIQKFKVNWVVLGPDLVVALSKFESLHEYDISSLSCVLVGGAATPEPAYRDLQKKLNGCMKQIYGMTEAMGIVRPREEGKFGNVGKLMPNCDAKVVDINTGELLGHNREGELCFRTPTTMKGYRNNPAETSAVLDDEGFLHSGDVGYFDEDGFLFIKDRVKDLIKYRRDHVPPIDIEEVLLAHPAVKEVGVVGVFHEEDWERATGVVVLRPGMSATSQELLQLVQDNLPSFKWLHGGLKFIDALPRTSSGKIQRKAIRDMLTQGRIP